MLSRALSLVFLVVATVPLVQAQGLASTSGVAIFRYAEPGQNTKDIQVWGAVRSAGIYQVERNTDLLTLLTLAGGPLLAGEDDRTIRTIDVRVIRDPSAARTVILDAPLGDLLSAEIALPDMQDGDLVQLTARTKQRFSWRDALSIATSVGALTLLVLRITE